MPALSFLAGIGTALDAYAKQQERQQKLQLSAMELKFQQQQMQLQNQKDAVWAHYDMAEAAQKDAPPPQDPATAPYQVSQQPGGPQGGGSSPQQGSPIPGARPMPGAQPPGGMPGAMPMGGGQPPMQPGMQPQQRPQGAGDPLSALLAQAPTIQTIARAMAKNAPPGTPPQAIMAAAREALPQAQKAWSDKLDVVKAQLAEQDRVRAAKDREQTHADNMLNVQSNFALRSQEHADNLAFRKLALAQTDEQRQDALLERRTQFDIEQRRLHDEFTQREQDKIYQEKNRPPNAEELKEINTASDINGLLDDIDSLKTRMQTGAASVGLVGMAKRGYETLTGPLGGDQSNRIFADDLVEVRRRLLGAVGRSGYLTKADRSEAEKLLLGLQPGDNPSRTLNSLNNAQKWMAQKFGHILKKYPSGEAAGSSDQTQPMSSPQFKYDAQGNRLP
jgi:hypothetical protein